MLHTIVQINLNHLIRQRVNFFLILVQLIILRLYLVQLFSQLDTLAGAGGSGHLFFQTFDGSTVARLLLVNIIGTDARNGIRLVAVQVDQALEAIFLTAVKQPVDGPLLVNFAVVGIEIVQEVVADDLFRLTLAASAFAIKRRLSSSELSPYTTRTNSTKRPTMSSSKYSSSQMGIIPSASGL